MGSLVVFSRSPSLESRGIGRARARRDLRLHRCHRHIACRPAVCDRHAIGVKLRRRRRALWRGQLITNSQVLKCSRVRRRMGQCARERLAALDEGLAPHIFLHPLRRRHPGTASLAPARRTRNRLFHSELIGEGGCVLESVLPFRRHVSQPMIDHLWSRQRGIKILEPSQADAVHPFQIELDALLGDVAIHPVPPNQWFCRIRRPPEALIQRVVRGLANVDPVKIVRTDAMANMRSSNARDRFMSAGPLRSIRDEREIPGRRALRDIEPCRDEILPIAMQNFQTDSSLEILSCCRDEFAAPL